MWIGAEGMMMCGTNGSQLWDTGFIAQALVETGLAELEENKAGLIRALEWLDESQMREDPMHFEVLYRHATKGAWGFRCVYDIPKRTVTNWLGSTKEQGYTVSDCTGEGLKAVMYLQNHLS